MGADAPRQSGWPARPTIAAEAMVTTNHPLATRAGIRALEDGGSAVDAALAAAAVLCVAEPTETGVGGDAFALVWDGARLHGLNGSGRAPAQPDRAGADDHGPRSVTVPGAVAAWAELAERFGRLGLDRAVAPAADLAARGLAVTGRIADKWALAERAPTPAPRAGERFRLPELAATLRRIAADGPDAFYRGPVAAAVAGATWLSEDDLAAHRSEWVEPLRLGYRRVEVCELPPNGQGAAALLALAIADGLEGRDEAERLHFDVEAVKLGLADARAEVADAPLPAWFLGAEHVAARRAAIRPDRALPLAPWRPQGGTTYVCCVDGERRAVSLIQSLYESFGSGVVAPGTGVVLHNRAAGFAREPGHPNALAPGRRPFHTIIPGVLLAHGGLLGPFGVMGGPMQPQGHFQLVRRLVDDGLDPQAALDAARFRVEADGSVALEPGLAPLAGALRARGHAVSLASAPHAFGVGQAILVDGECLVGGSDRRGDGHAAGL